MSVTLLLFARTPVLGRAKTRLLPALGAERTHALYRAFLADTLATARTAAGVDAVAWAHTGNPDSDDRRRADLAFPQRGATFGERLDAAIVDVRRARGAGPLLVLGADTPHLAPVAVSAMASELATRPAVLGPSTKGGFYAAGFASTPPPLEPVFRAPGEALALARMLEAAGTPATLLAPLFDVDEPDDLRELAGLLALADACGAWVPPATYRCIQDRGLGEFVR